MSVARIEPADHEGHRWLLYYCPGCRHCHTVPEGRWTWSGDMENAPTLSPSVRHSLDGGTTCHYFIRAGRFEFCGDCVHELAGQTVPMVAEPWPDYDDGTPR